MSRLKHAAAHIIFLRVKSGWRCYCALVTPTRVGSVPKTCSSYTLTSLDHVLILAAHGMAPRGQSGWALWTTTMTPIRAGKRPETMPMISCSWAGSRKILTATMSWKSCTPDGLCWERWAPSSRVSMTHGMSVCILRV